MRALDVLKRYFGYDSFRKGQDELISAILDGQDVLGIMPTGAGKSICYQVPALILPGITLVVSPLISLMNDQVKALNQAGIHAAYINSSLSEAQICKALMLAAQGRYKIIYVAPERLETSAFKDFVRQVDISMVTVDEAHCISQWGQDFRPSYLKIVQFIRGLKKRPVVSAFTATATQRVKEDILCVLDLQNPKVLVTGFDRSNLYFGVNTTRKKDDFVRSYISEHHDESGIIYCATRKNVDKLYELLKSNQISVARYHAGLSADERQKNQDDFIYDRTPVMVATNAFGMGIDKSNVRYVLHYNMPQSMENYYQEAGRAGRDGEYSECILLYSPQDVVINRFLLDNREPNPELTAEDNQSVREQDEKRLQAMIYYCQTTNCLRDYILRYFGEYGNGSCSNCSSCNNEYEQLDVTEEALKIISCVGEVHSRYGINVIAGMLAGSDRAKLKEYNVAVYKSYGALKQKSEPEIKQVIQYLLLEDYLEVTNDKYALIHLTEKSGVISEEGFRLVMKLPKVSSNNGVSYSAKKSARRSDVLNSKGLDLFEKLRALRMQLAKEGNVPPYMIFSDKTLMDMCVKLPQTEEEMFTVNGIGQIKFDKYGAQFMQVIHEFTGGSSEKLYFGNEPEIPSTKKDSRKDSIKIPKTEFYLTEQQAEKFPYAESYLVTEIAEKLSSLRDENTVKKITGAEIFRIMQADGYASEGYIDGMRKKSVSPAGKEAGLFIGMRLSRKGTEYEDIYYNEKAQRMIVSRYIKESK